MKITELTTSDVRKYLRAARRVFPATAYEVQVWQRELERRRKLRRGMTAGVGGAG